MTTVATYLVESLVAAGVRRIYGVVGDSLNSIVDAVHQNKKMEWIHVRHEEAGAVAASAEAQLTGNLAVCAGSCGPGNLHLINGLFDAHKTLAPVLAIAAQIPSSEIGTDFFQETHPERLFLECSHFCQLVGVEQEVFALAERLKAPIAYSFRGKVFLEYDNPYATGMTGLLGTESGHYALETADLAFLLGTDFPYTAW